MQGQHAVEDDAGRVIVLRCGCALVAGRRAQRSHHLDKPVLALLGASPGWGMGCRQCIEQTLHSRSLLSHGERPRLGDGRCHPRPLGPRGARGQCVEQMQEPSMAWRIASGRRYDCAGSGARAAPLAHAVFQLGCGR